MNCKKYIDMLPLYATGDLDQAEQSDVKAHLESCEDCRKEMKQFFDIISTLSVSDSRGLTELERLKLENDIFRRLASEKILVDTNRRSNFSVNFLRVAAAIILFFMGFTIKSIMTEPEAKIEYDAKQVMLTSLEKSERRQSAASGMRFTEAGFKLIAGGKSAEKVDLKSN